MNAATLKKAPQPGGLPLLGNFLDFRSDPLQFLTKAARDYGDIVHVDVLGNHIYLISHPDYIKKILIDDNEKFTKDKGLKLIKRFFLGNGLLTSEGETHRLQRKMSAPAFNKKRIHSYAQPMIDLTEKHIASWQTGDKKDLDQEMMALTAKIAAKTLFNTDLEDEVGEIGNALSDVLEMVRFLISPIVDIAMSLPLPVTQQVKSGMARLDKTVYRFIDEHLERGEDQGDFLSMLIKTKSEQGIDLNQTANKKQLRDEALTIFLAGHETTSNALMWAWYLLSQNKDKEKLMHDEVDALPEKISLEQLSNLSYTRNVLAESMRLFPPAWAIGRVSAEDYEIGGYLIPKESEIWLSQYVVHRDPRWFKYPLRFEPERFASEIADARPKYSYFPFSAGVRNCIGEQFAWLEGTLILAAIGKKLSFDLVPGHKVETEPLVTLRAKHGMQMVVQKRN